MKYVLLFCHTAEEDAAWRSAPPDELAAGYAEVGKWFETNGRHFEGGLELQAPATATTVRKRADGSVHVTDGPFAESGEVIGGFVIMNAENLDEALDVAKTWPGGHVEVRPVIEGREA
jgi:hypothetical protein